jgi:NTP pyrophosphatase (non-canonical NTP hydrolase)
MPSNKHNIKTISGAQQLVKDLALRNNWDDSPNIDKFDHLHEELVEMSYLLRYKNQQERIEAIQEHHDELLDGMGDLLFATCRLANQLQVDLQEAFNVVTSNILKGYTNRHPESIKR